MPSQARQTAPASQASEVAPAAAQTQNAQGRFGNAFLAEQLNQRGAEGPAAAPDAALAAGDQAWTDGTPLKAANPAPVRAGEQRRTVCGVQIIGTDVSPTALDSCERFVRMTIGNRPDIQQRMQEANVALVIIPRDKTMTDVAEFSALRGQNTFDGRPWSTVRGSGGMRAGGGLWAIAVPEENLVQTTPDRDGYGSGYSVGLHEFAHTIQSKGVNDAERRQILALYAARRAAGGPWTEAYGASNDQEYFAQSTNCFFNENARIGNNGPQWLMTNDRPMYDFLVRLYGAPRPQRADAGMGDHNVPSGDTAVA